MPEHSEFVPDQDQSGKNSRKTHSKKIIFLLFVLMFAWYFTVGFLLRRGVITPGLSFVLGIPPIIVPMAVYRVLQNRQR